MKVENNEDGTFNIILENGDTIFLTTELDKFETAVIVEGTPKGQMIITGGSSLIERIEGEGIQNKFFDENEMNKILAERRNK